MAIIQRICEKCGKEFINNSGKCPECGYTDVESFDYEGLDQQE